MNTKHTLKELADIGAKAAANRLKGYSLQCTAEFYSYDQIEHIESREAFTQAILDAIGYEFPKDEEREAFERRLSEQGDGFHPCGDIDKAFTVWKAGREELRKAINKPPYSMPEYYGGITLLASEQVPLTTEQRQAADACLKEEMKAAEPAWIPWEGGECPLPDGVRRWEARCRDGWTEIVTDSKSEGWWHHSGRIGEIVAYRILE